MMLSGKQRRFLEEYLICWNAAEAARRAGYSPKTARQTGSRLLTNVDIQAEIRLRLAEHAMSAQEVLHHLTEIGRGDIGDFWTGSRLGLPHNDYGETDRRRSMLVKKMVITERVDGDNATIIRTELELYDRLRALEALAKYHDLTNRVKHETWEDQAVADIRAGVIPVEAYPEMVEQFGRDLATQLYARAGIAVEVGTDSGEVPTSDDFDAQ